MFYLPPDVFFPASFVCVVSVSLLLMFPLIFRLPNGQAIPVEIPATPVVSSAAQTGTTTSSTSVASMVASPPNAQDKSPQQSLAKMVSVFSPVPAQRNTHIHVIRSRFLWFLLTFLYVSCSVVSLFQCNSCLPSRPPPIPEAEASAGLQQHGCPARLQQDLPGQHSWPHRWDDALT